MSTGRPARGAAWGPAEEGQWSGSAWPAAVLPRFGQSLLLSVAGVSAGGRKPKDHWTSPSQTFLPASSGVGSRRGARLGPIPHPGPGREAGPELPSHAPRICGRGRQAGSHRRGRRTDGWTHPPALSLSPARGGGGSQGPGEQRRVPGRGRSASLTRHPRPLGRPRLAPPAPGCAPKPASLAAKADGTRSGASQKGAWSQRRGRASPRAAAFPAADLAAAPAPAPAPAPQRPPAAPAVPAPERSPRPEPEPEPEPGASPARGRRGCGERAGAMLPEPPPPPPPPR